MAYSYKGSISFGLVYIPIKLETCVRNNDISFNLLDKKTMSRVKYKKTCVDCEDREVKNDEIVKGYQYEENKYIIFDDSDFEKIKSAKDKNITIEQFVSLDEIDPIYYDKPYYVVPTGGEKAYSLLVKAMEDENKVGIAKTVLGTKETLVSVRVKDGRMILNTLHFHDEIQKNSSSVADSKINDKELNLAKTLINAMSGEFSPQEFKDEYREKIMNAIEEKIAGKEVSEPKNAKGNNIIDLMEALEKSLTTAAGKKAQPKTIKTSPRKTINRSNKTKIKKAQ